MGSTTLPRGVTRSTHLIRPISSACMSKQPTKHRTRGMPQPRSRPSKRSTNISCVRCMTNCGVEASIAFWYRPITQRRSARRRTATGLCRRRVRYRTRWSGHLRRAFCRGFDTRLRRRLEADEILPQLSNSINNLKSQIINLKCCPCRSLSKSLAAPVSPIVKRS